MTKVLDIIGANKLLNPIYKKYLWGNKHLTQIYFGGSSSGKSFAIAQRAVLDVLNGRNYLVVRKTGASIAKSSFNEIREKIYQFKLQSFFRINASAFTITCTLNSCQFIFTGLDDVEKVKSIRPLTGVITDIWIEEATEISVNDYRQLTKRLRGVSRFPKRITMSFNPILKTHWIYKEFFATLWRDDQQYVEDKTTSILKTTYKDNVHLMPDDIERLESETDPYYRDVYLLGNWGTLSGVIYNNWKVMDFNKESFANYRCGLDWGFSSDEFAFVRLAIDVKRKQIYVCDEIYQTDLLNDKAIELVKPLAQGCIVWCDSAEPKSIAEFRANGINAKPVKKGQGSIEQGINFLKRFDIFVHPNCVNTIKELSTYHYKTDRNTGEPLPVPADVDNHICVAKGTMVSTKKGRIAIENIKVGDLVYTRKGYKKVLAAGRTGIRQKVIKVQSGENIQPFLGQFYQPAQHTIWVTPNHQIYDQEKKCFVEAKDFGESYGLVMDMALIPDSLRTYPEEYKYSDVYNITVEDAHEFLANGILVKNCDALRYATEYDALMRGSVKDVL